MILNGRYLRFLSLIFSHEKMFHHVPHPRMLLKPVNKRLSGFCRGVRFSHPLYPKKPVNPVFTGSLYFFYYSNFFFKSFSIGTSINLHARYPTVIHTVTVKIRKPLCRIYGTRRSCNFITYFKTVIWERYRAKLKDETSFMIFCNLPCLINEGKTAAAITKSAITISQANHLNSLYTIAIIHNMAKENMCFSLQA